MPFKVKISDGNEILVDEGNTILEAMKTNFDTKMSSFNKGLKFVIFLVLLVTVIWQYAVEIYSKFENDSTTFVSRTIDTDNFTMPPITICMDNGLKPSVLKKYKMAETSLKF